MEPTFQKELHPPTGFMTQPRYRHQTPTRRAWELSLATGTEGHLLHPFCIKKRRNEPQQSHVTDSFGELPISLSWSISRYGSMIHLLGRHRNLYCKGTVASDSVRRSLSEEQSYLIL